MSMEMAELGTGEKHIDGNSVFKANAIEYDEEQFKNENLKSALNDLDYLVKTYNNSDDIFYTAKTYQLLENYEQSNEAFNLLLNDGEYSDSALYYISENHIHLKRYDDAINEINKLLLKYPKESQLFDKLSEVYELKNDKPKSLEFQRKAIYYENVPALTNLNYSDDNFSLLEFFGSTKNSTDKKLKKLNEIAKANNQQYTIDVCLMILKLHANHGNGVEERATEILAQMGKPCLDKVHSLFQSNVSTCTITNLSEIMASIKDEDSWELLRAYLPEIANMSTTLIPPSIPEKMIEFDEDKGIKEILRVIKNLLNEENNSMSEMGSLSEYVYYSPLEKINKTKLREIATELNYSDKEFEQLQEKIEENKQEIN